MSQVIAGRMVPLLCIVPLTPTPREEARKRGRVARPPAQSSWEVVVLPEP